MCTYDSWRWRSASFAVNLRILALCRTKSRIYSKYIPTSFRTHFDLTTIVVFFPLEFLKVSVKSPTSYPIVYIRMSYHSCCIGKLEKKWRILYLYHCFYIYIHIIYIRGVLDILLIWFGLSYSKFVSETCDKPYHN